ncbi:MAG: EAL domain-containing protein [Roseburia sp.]|nr:EAL domain-containing protein [Roseburia sp.]
MSFEEWIDRNELQRIQDEFCEATGVFACCLDREKNRMTRISGNREQLEEVAPCFDSPRLRMALNRVEGDSLEEVAIEETEAGAAAAVAIRIDGQAAFYWAVLQIDKENQIKNQMSFSGLQKILDLLRDGSYMIFRQKLKPWNAERKSREREEVCQRRGKTTETMEAITAMLDNVGSAVCVVDQKADQLLFANSRMKDIFAGEFCDKAFREFLERETNKAEGGQSVEIYYAVRERWYDLSFKQTSWVDGRSVMLYALYDITDKKLYQKRIEQQAHTDFLTGLYNRMCCEGDLARQIDEAKIKGGTGALLYLDLDDFKHINDGLGHQYGDVLLKAISHALQRIEGIENACYRMGGDEFVVLISPDVFPDFDRIVEDIRKIFSRPWFLKDADYYCTMSMGIVTFPDNGESVIDLIKKADIAMYEAKKGGKNRLARYSDNIGASSGRRLDMEKNMRNAAADGYREFVIYYQPIIDVHGEEIECAGAEALIRWNSANLGFVSPAEFIPLAEYLGLIHPIGNYVLLEACRTCKKWNDSGYPDYKVNVNLSVVQLLQPDIVEEVARALRETGIQPKNLTLEVTESLAINDMGRMKAILGKIKALGVSLALDDFGTGYSSLNHIREIPFDIIKVDQSFVKELARDVYAKSFVRMVSELAEAIGMSVCVEGIETINQYAVLEGMKIKYIQGYFFDKPMLREEFETKYVQ